MKKLHLDGLRVDSFATGADAAPARGTVAAREEIDTNLHCPDSYGGTCWITCGESCPCDTSVFACN